MQASSSFWLRQMAKPMLGLFVLSVALGLAYNRASPLGVRWGGSNSSSRPDASVASARHSLYFNETIAAALEAPHQAHVAESGYGNETVAMALVPPLVSREATQPLPSRASAAKEQMAEMTWAEARPLVQTGKLLPVDVRGHFYHQAGHIPGAVSLPFNATSEEMAAFKTNYSKNTPLLFYCGSAQCPLAHRMAQNLISQHGYATVVVLGGGYTAWRLAESQIGLGTLGSK